MTNDCIIAHNKYNINIQKNVSSVLKLQNSLEYIMNNKYAVYVDNNIIEYIFNASITNFFIVKKIIS
jgi:hypothetical protein